MDSTCIEMLGFPPNNIQDISKKKEKMELYKTEMKMKSIQECIILS